jgi:Zn-dependent protease with chaperone function
MLAAGAASLAFVAAVHAIDEQEQRERIEFQVRELERELEVSGALHGDAALDAYLQSVVDRLYPEQQGRLRVRACKDPEFNAFAVPTGNLYVNIGALLRMRNEAELAALLGHEGAHVVRDHSYRGVRSAKAMGVVGTIVSAGLLVGIGIDPGIGAIASYSSMAGFSREYERESDQMGFARATAAGYDAGAGAVIFDRMARELEARRIKQGPYFFASHPRLQERAQNFSELAADAPPGELRRDEYVAATQAARMSALEMILARKNGRELAFVLAEGGLADEMAPLGPFALGEGYRLRGDPGDDVLALEQYRKSVELFPDFAPAWGALGRHYARTGESALAIECLERYLALAPDAREAPFARQALERLKSEVAP